MQGGPSRQRGRVHQRLLRAFRIYMAQGGVRYLPWYAVAFIEQERLPESFVVRV